MSQPTQYGSTCPNCHNRRTTPDVLAKLAGRRSYPIVLTGCDVCHSMWKEEKPVADCETQ